MSVLKIVAISVVLLFLLTVPQKIKELHIKHEIKKTNYCQLDSDCEKNLTYQEIVTKFDSKYLADHWRHDTMENEKNKLKNIGVDFFSNNSGVVKENKLKEVRLEIECGDIKKSCRKKDVVYPDGFEKSWSSHYEYNDSQYDVFLDSDYKEKLDSARYCIFENGQEFFCASMNTDAEGPVQQAVNINNKPAFTFRTARVEGAKLQSDIVYNNE